MDQQQQKLRSAATRAFMESLDHLEQALQETASMPETPAAPPKQIQPPSPDAEFDLSSFEQAAADIEQFMQARQDASESVQD